MPTKRNQDEEAKPPQKSTILQTKTERTRTKRDARTLHPQNHQPTTIEIRIDKITDRIHDLQETNEVLRLRGIVRPFCQTQRRHCHV